MKKLKFLLAATVVGLLAACTSNPKSNDSADPSSSEPVSGDVSNSDSSQAPVTPVMTIDYAAKKADYVNTPFAITAEDADGNPIENGYIREGNLITINVAGTYVLEGYLKGQILVKVNGVEIELNAAYLENDEGKAPIYCDVAITDPAAEAREKLEIKPADGTASYVVQYGGTYNKSNKDTAGAIVSTCDLDLGGKGTLYAVGTLKHGIKGEKVTVKSTGTRFIQGTTDGSAVNCDLLIDKKDNKSNSKLYVINSGNGIKADSGIDLSCAKGTTVHIYDCATGMKTEKKASEYITLGTGMILYHQHVTTLFDTNEAGLTNNATVNPTEA